MQMAKLAINNSYSRITGLSVGHQKALHELLSFIVGGKSAYFSKYGPRRKSLLSNSGEFPTGLLKRVYDFIQDNNLQYEIRDLRQMPIKRINSPATTFEHKPWVDQAQAVKAAVSHVRGIISMPTGTGKSNVIALIAEELRVKTLVIVPSIEIKKQLASSLANMPWVTVKNIDDPSLQKYTDYGCLMIDEAHHTAAKTYQKLNKTAWTGIFYRFYLTATPFRNDNEETLLFESIAGQVIYQLTYKTAIAKGYIVPVEAYYIDLPKQHTDAYTYAQVYKQLVTDNDLRNILLAQLLQQLEASKISTLCLVREVEHGSLISRLAKVAYVNGTDNDSRDFVRQFNKRIINTLVGTTGILGEGIDTKPCEYAIIAGLGKAKSQFMQQVGRAVRKYPGKESAKIIIFRDPSHKFTLRHFNEQKKILKEEYGCIVMRLDV